MSYQFNPFTGSFDETSSTSPGGSDTQVQFNDGGSFGGDSGLTFNKTTNALTVGGATVTADAPVLNLSQTWNNAGVTFTGLKFNVTDTASHANSLLMDLQVGGVSKFKVDKSGTITVQPGDSSTFGIRSASAGMSYYGTQHAFITSSGNWNVRVSSSGLEVLGTSSILFGIGNSSVDTVFLREAANTLAQRNSTNAQESRVYATYTSGTSYQRCGIKTAKTTLSAVSGASVTASSLIPAGAFLIGVTSRVNTALGTSNGTTGYQVGTASDPDLWGAITGTAEGTASGSANYTAPGASGLFTEATNVIVTAVGGNFNATGVIELAIHYLLTEAD